MKRKGINEYLNAIEALNKSVEMPFKKMLEQQNAINKALYSSSLSKAMESALVSRKALDLGQMTTFASLTAASRAFDSLFDYSSLSAFKNFEAVNAALERINSSILDADFLAAIELEDMGAESADAPVELSEPSRGQIIEVVSEETFRTLEQVEFAPLRVLNEAMRNPEIIRSLNGRQFEELVALLIEKLGFDQVKLTPASGDGGRDILATKEVSGIPIIFAFECKCYAAHRPVGPDIARALLGVITHPATAATKGVLVTTSTISPAATEFILTEPRLDGKDYSDVVSWIGDIGPGDTEIA